MSFFLSQLREGETLHGVFLLTSFWKNGSRCDFCIDSREVGESMVANSVSSSTSLKVKFTLKVSALYCFARNSSVQVRRKRCSARKIIKERKLAFCFKKSLEPRDQSRVVISFNHLEVKTCRNFLEGNYLVQHQHDCLVSPRAWLWFLH